jgi:hypothetical protein
MEHLPYLTKPKLLSANVFQGKKALILFATLEQYLK